MKVLLITSSNLTYRLYIGNVGNLALLVAVALTFSCDYGLIISPFFFFFFFPFLFHSLPVMTLKNYCYNRAAIRLVLAVSPL